MIGAVLLDLFPSLSDLPSLLGLSGGSKLGVEVDIGRVFPSNTRSVSCKFDPQELSRMFFAFELTGGDLSSKLSGGSGCTVSSFGSPLLCSTVSSILTATGCSNFFSSSPSTIVRRKWQSSSHLCYAPRYLHKNLFGHETPSPCGKSAEPIPRIDYPAAQNHGYGII
jgi:hypothetical protein